MCLLDAWSGLGELASHRRRAGARGPVVQCGQPQVGYGMERSRLLRDFLPQGDEELVHTFR